MSDVEGRIISHATGTLVFSFMKTVVTRCYLPKVLFSQKALGYARRRIENLATYCWPWIRTASMFAAIHDVAFAGAV